MGNKKVFTQTNLATENQQRVSALKSSCNYILDIKSAFIRTQNLFGHAYIATYNIL